MIDTALDGGRDHKYVSGVRLFIIGTAHLSWQVTNEFPVNSYGLTFTIHGLTAEATIIRVQRNDSQDY